MLIKDVTKVPQVFIPYKEVLDIYHAGLQVPDDVTLMWCDDNYGYIRHFPTAEECARKGGNGVYYHVSMIVRCVLCKVRAFFMMRTHQSKSAEYR